MIILLCLLLDAVVHAVCGKSLVQLTLVYTAYCLLSDEESLRNVGWYGAVFFVLIEDYMLYGRCGMALFALVPLFCMVCLLRHRLFQARSVLFFFIVIGFLGVYDVIVRYVLFLENPLNSVTISRILINLILGYVIFWGTQGNRSLQRKGRKVWTPSRKDAS